MLRMKKAIIIPVAIIALIATLFDSYFSVNKLSVSHDIQEISIIYPSELILFPPDSSPPTFRWDDRTEEIHHWKVYVDCMDDKEPERAICYTMDWQPDSETWEKIKNRSKGGTAKFTIMGCSKPFGKNHLGMTKSAGTAGFSIRAH